MSQAKTLFCIQQSLIEAIFKDVSAVTAPKDGGIGSSEIKRVGWLGL
jgi:hypothetical protein